MTTHGPVDGPEPDFESQLRSTLAGHEHDVRPRRGAVDAVVAGVGRAKRRRAAATVSAAAVAVIVIGGVAVGVSRPEADIAPVTTPSVGIDSQPPTASATSSMPTATPSVTPSGTLSSAPPNSPPASSQPPPTTPAAIDLQRLTATGIGDIELGMSIADAFATGTLDGEQPTPQDACGIARRTTPDHALVYFDATGVIQVDLVRGTADPGTSTLEGLSLRSTSGEVEEVFPGLDLHSPPAADGVADYRGSGNLLAFQATAEGGALLAYISLRAGGASACYG